MLAEIIWNERTLSVVGAFAIPIVGIICGVWHSVAVTTSQNELKRSMIERGMSAEEIERVLAARSPKPPKP